MIIEDKTLGNYYLEALGEYQENFDINVKWLSSFDIKALEDCSVLVMDINLVKKTKELKILLDKEGVGHTILISDKYHSKEMEIASMLGFTTHYIKNPTLSLIEKILGGRERISEANKATVIEKNRDKKAHYFCVYSPQGGTGKSTISTNLAIEYAKAKKRVLLVDFSQIGSINALFQVSSDGKGLSNLIDEVGETLSQIKVHEAIHRYEKNNVVLDILFAASVIKMEKLKSIEVEKIVKQIRLMEYEVVIFDTTSEVCERTLSLMDMMDSILLVSTPDIMASWKMFQLKEIFKNIGVEGKCLLVLNKFSKYYGFSVPELINELQYPLLGTIRENKHVTLASNDGVPIAFSQGGRYNKELYTIANSLISIDSPKKEKRKLSFKRKK